MFGGNATLFEHGIEVTHGSNNSLSFCAYAYDYYDDFSYAYDYYACDYNYYAYASAYAYAYASCVDIIHAAILLVVNCSEKMLHCLGTK